LARRLGLDYVTAARGGLLHDFFLYDSKDKSQFEGIQCFAHPKIAVKNADMVCDLSEKEKNIIVSHMWPISPKMPKSREAFIVNLADKYCATMEVLHVWHRLKMPKHMPRPVFMPA